MNEQPNKTAFREGFVDPKAQAAPQPAQPAPMPPPEIAPSPADLAEPADVWPIVVKLFHKPVRNNAGDMLREISFREPTGGDINRYGNPVRIDQNGEVVIEERKMMMIMAQLSGILPPFLEQMDPRDWNSCAYRLRRFFLPDLRALLEATPTT